MRWHGLIGFENVSEENNSGIYSPTITEKTYSGDQYAYKAIYRSGSNPNGSITTNTTISIYVNPWLSKNYDRIVYATIQGVKWSVSEVDLTDCRRLKLTLGGRYVDKVRVSSNTTESNDSSGGSGSSNDNWWES